MSDSIPDPRPPAMDYARPEHRPERKPSAVWATIALAMGLLGFAGPFASWIGAAGAPLTILVAIVALVLCYRYPARHRGRGRAWIGLLGGLAGIGWWLFLVQARTRSYGPWGVLAQCDTRGALTYTWEGLGIYRGQNGGALPTDLDELSRVVDNPGGLLVYFAESGNTITDLHYVSELSPDDPDRWIIAYADPSLFNGEGGGILRLDGTVELHDASTFSNALTDFERDFLQDRGYPPMIIPPE